MSGRGSAKGLGIAVARASFQSRAAGIGQAEKFRGFVEGFADGVIQRGAELAVAPNPLDHDALRMTAGEQQQQIRKAGLRGAQARQAGGEARGLPDG